MEPSLLQMDEEKCLKQNEALKIAGEQMQNLEKVLPCPLVQNEATALKSKADEQSSMNPVKSPVRSPIMSLQYGILTTQNTNVIVSDNPNTTANKQIGKLENTMYSSTDGKRSDVEKDEFFSGMPYIYPFCEYFVKSD